MVCVTALKQCTEQMRTVGQKKRITPFYFNTNYRTEMKLVSNTIDYCQLQFKILLRGCVYMGRGLYLTLIYSMETPKIFNEIVKYTSQIAWKEIFATFLTLV